MLLCITDKICGTDLSHMQLISRYNKRIVFLFCVIHVHKKCKWLISLTDKKVETPTTVFQKIEDDLICKRKTIWLDKMNEFYNRSTKSWLKNAKINVYFTPDKEKSVVAERLEILKS